MTGRRLGYCAGYDAPGFMHPGAGYGPGYGRGFRGGGFGWRYMHRAYAEAGGPRYGYPPMWDIPPAAPAWSADDELAALKEQAERLQGALNDINRRIAELIQTDE